MEFNIWKWLLLLEVLLDLRVSLKFITWRLAHHRETGSSSNQVQVRDGEGQQQFGKTDDSCNRLHFVICRQHLEYFYMSFSLLQLCEFSQTTVSIKAFLEWIKNPHSSSRSNNMPIIHCTDMFEVGIYLKGHTYQQVIQWQPVRVSG